MIEQYTLKCEGGALVRCFVQEKGDCFQGVCVIPTPEGNIKLAAKLPKTIVYAMCKKMMDMESAGGAETGRRRRRRRRRLFRRVGRGQLLRKLGKASNRILQSRLVKGAVKAARFIPGYGQAIQQGYKAASQASRIASRIGRGDRRARQAVSRLRQAATRNPRARAALQTIRGAYRRQFGQQARRMLRSGARTSGDLSVVTGANCLFGEMNNAETGFAMPRLITRGHRPESETFGLRDAYNLGLQELAQG